MMENWKIGSRSPNHRAYMPPARPVNVADTTYATSL